MCNDGYLKISEKKTKVMTFLKKLPVRSEIAVNEQPIELVKHVKFQGCDFGYEFENDITDKLHKHQLMSGSIYRQLQEKQN